MNNSKNTLKVGGETGRAKINKNNEKYYYDMRLMEYFNLTARTACNCTRWLINTMPVYLPDRKHIRLLPLPAIHSLIKG